MLLWEEGELNWFNNTCLENRARSYGWSIPGITWTRLWVVRSYYVLERTTEISIFFFVFDASF